jgi:hypothetical protein
MANSKAGTALNRADRWNFGACLLVVLVEDSGGLEGEVQAAVQGAGGDMSAAGDRDCLLEWRDVVGAPAIQWILREGNRQGQSFFRSAGRRGGPSLCPVVGPERTAG